MEPGYDSAGWKWVLMLSQCALSAIVEGGRHREATEKLLFHIDMCQLRIVLSV
jgi:hypothetical protein